MNVPAVHASRSARASRSRGWDVGCTPTSCVERLDPRGIPYFWIGGPPPSGLAVPGTDFHAVVNRRIAITPIHLDLTGRSLLKRLHTWEWALPGPPRRRAIRQPTDGGRHLNTEETTMDDLSGLMKGLGGDAAVAARIRRPRYRASPARSARTVASMAWSTSFATPGSATRSTPGSAADPNQPVDPQQLGAALGDDEVQRLSAGPGLDIAALLPMLAAFLPQIIDMLTPNGAVPDGGLDGAIGSGGMPDLGGLLGGLMGGAGAGAAGPAASAGGLDDLLGGLGGLMGGGQDR